jgi:hypothetical protein
MVGHVCVVGKILDELLEIIKLVRPAGNDRELGCLAGVPRKLSPATAAGTLATAMARRETGLS